MITKLNLPKPSKNIIDRVFELSETADLEIELKNKHDSIQNFTKNSVSRKFIENDYIIQELAQKEYSNFFDEKIIPAVGIIKNIQKEKYACWPPHSDRVRIFALNYYIQEGGEYVTTVTYNTIDNHIAGTGTGKIYRYEDLEIDTVYHTEMNSWYALSVRQAHSIENIETTRLIFTLSFWDITYDKFIEKYNKYLFVN